MVRPYKGLERPDRSVTKEKTPKELLEDLASIWKSVFSQEGGNPHLFFDKSREGRQYRDALKRGLAQNTDVVKAFLIAIIQGEVSLAELDPPEIKGYKEGLNRSLAKIRESLGSTDFRSWHPQKWERLVNDLKAVFRQSATRVKGGTNRRLVNTWQNRAQSLFDFLGSLLYSSSTSRNNTKRKR